MAVAVKTTPGEKPATSTASPAVMSLVGVAYLVACLALLFQVIPGLFWPAWQSVGLAKYSFQGGSLLFLVCLAAAGVMVYVGGQLLGANPPAGVRAGAFTALMGLLLVILLSRWASLWIEYWAYEGLFSPQAGIIVTSGVAVVLLLVFLRIFFRKDVQQQVVHFEQAGWFHATHYKGNQGQMVRRATIFGILLLAGAGVYSLINGNSLHRYGPDWSIPIPFTGVVDIESFGDGESYIADDSIIPTSAKATVEIRFPGSTPLEVGRVLSLEGYKGAVEAVLAKDKNLAGTHGPDLARAESKGAVAYVQEVNRIVYAAINAWLDQPLAERLLDNNMVRQLHGVDNETDMADLSRLLVEFRREVSKAAAGRIRVKSAGDSASMKRQLGKVVTRSEFNQAISNVPEGKTVPEGESVGHLGPVFDLPLAVLRVDRFALQKVETDLDPNKLVFVTDPGDTVAAFKDSKENASLVLARGLIVSRTKLDEATEKLQSSNLGYVNMPIGRPVSPPSGPTRYAQLTLLPSITLTVPLLLMALSVWLAWRVVNVPAFADFLIATEAEMNKVSWTTQKRLVQDTIVVLVTVFLMAVFLFLVDWGWKMLLQGIRVLHIPQESAEKQIKVEDKKY